MRTIFLNSPRRRWRSALNSFAALIGVAVLFFALGYFIGGKT